MQQLFPQILCIAVQLDSGGRGEVDLNLRAARWEAPWVLEGVCGCSWLQAGGMWLAGVGKKVNFKIGCVFISGLVGAAWLLSAGSRQELRLVEIHNISECVCSFVTLLLARTKKCPSSNPRSGITFHSISG